MLPRSEASCALLMPHAVVPPSPQAALAKILSYHVVPGEALTLDQLTDGLILQTLVDGPEGELKVCVWHLR